MRTALPAVYFQTLGCAKNEVDTRHMALRLADEGFAIVDTPQNAAILVVNTCGFLEAATRESLEAVLELAEDKGDKLLIMAGCVPARYHKELKGSLPADLPEVDAFIDVASEKNIASILRELWEKKLQQPHQELQQNQQQHHQQQVQRPQQTQMQQLQQNQNQQQNQQAQQQKTDTTKTKMAASSSHATPLPASTSTASQGWAYVKISDGCNRFCSFCTIPFIRGRYHSRSYADIEQEVRTLLEEGVQEIDFVGQDTGVYGQDITDKNEPQSLAQLVWKLAPLLREHSAKMRLLYIQPDGMDEELIEAYAHCDELLKYIDIPVQHTSARLLKAMKRKGSAGEFKELFKTLRVRVPNLTLRTTLMVGFPAETEEDVSELLSFVEEVGFDYVSSFAYSQEEPARAAYLPQQIPKEVKLERLQKLLDCVQATGEKKAAEHVGEKTRVLVCGEEDGETVGRAWFQAPDSDGVVIIEGATIAPGTSVSVELEESCGFDLIGSIADD